MSDDEVEIIPKPADVFTWPQQPDESHYQYIVRDKERCVIEGPIEAQDVARPKNGKFTVKDVKDPEWRQKSWFRCPTYGNCTKCYRSGPVAMGCSFCNNKDAGYLILGILRDGNSRQQYIDAEWLASKLYKTGHVVAMANRKVGWLTTPTRRINEDVDISKIFRTMEFDHSAPDAEIMKRSFDVLRSHQNLQAAKMKYDLMAGWYGQEV